MSDYVQDQEYSMQLAAVEDDPAFYDWARLHEDIDQAIPTLFADITSASLLEETGVEDVDWPSLDNTLKTSPWRDLWVEGLDHQGAAAQPDDERYNGTHALHGISKLDALQQDLLDTHDNKGRKRFASLLAQSGCHHETANVLCPVCLELNTLKTHEDFKEHLSHNHLGSFRLPDADEDTWSNYGCAFRYKDANIPGGYRWYDAIPRKLHEHRRTILSLWPASSKYPVWADIQECSRARNL
ncbi:hypothetical protein E8E11_005355 [Didymella keratinophila]|nr:hypothetical protein E8E11_005355 [Didymella keratinophila]